MQQLSEGDSAAIYGGGAAGGIGGSRLCEQLKPLDAPSVLQVPIARQPGALPGGDIQGSLNRSDQMNKGMRSQPLPQAGTAAVQHQQHTESGASIAVAKSSVLVKDVLRAVQGLKGTYMSFTPGAANPADVSAGLKLASAAEVAIPEGQRTLIHELGELGVMFMRVQAAIAEGHQPGAGSVRQALCGALYEEVTDFYRLIAVLEGQLSVPPPIPGDAAAAGPGGPQDTYLTLRRLQLWLSEPLRRMRLLACLVDAAAGCVGGDLAGRVWAASKVGDPLARAYATCILQQVCVPLFDMIRHWVFDGQLQDPACEFFIVPNSRAAVAGSNTSSSSGGSDGARALQQQLSGSSGAADLWRDAHRLEPAKLPPFISQDLAKTIERAGKSINFLRDACGDSQWVQDWAPAAAAAAAALGYGQLPVLERVVVSASRAVDARLMEVLRSTGDWERHCNAVRRYLLLGQGDFVVAFLDIVGPELSKAHDPKADNTPQLNHLLRQALLSCAGGGRLDEEANGPLQLLGIKLSKAAGATDVYWDLFSLRYALGPPLSSIFTPAAQAQYSRLSKLLWRLRRAERSLNDAWRTLKVEIERSLPQFKADACVEQLDDLLRLCLRLHAQMAHITTNLQYYINLEVVECAWSEFMSAAAAAPDLDCLIAAHDKFLASVLDRALLGGGKAEALRATLTALLANCMDLMGPVKQLKDKVHAGLRELDARERQVARNTAAGGWGLSGSWGPAVPPEDLAWLHDTLRATQQHHSQLLQEFLRGLPEAANEVNAEVRFLLARLDFTDFYKGQ